MKDELMVVAACLLITCALLGLRQLIIKGRKPGGIFIMRFDNDDGDHGTDNPYDDWPSEIEIPEELLFRMKLPCKSKAQVARAGATEGKAHTVVTSNFVGI